MRRPLGPVSRGLVSRVVPESLAFRVRLNRVRPVRLVCRVRVHLLLVCLVSLRRVSLCRFSLRLSLRLVWLRRVRVCRVVWWRRGRR
ncbi:hypothetical protein, partial [Nocardia barduliensis]|uniref:hypothetical protein n=1 Tax=Nocardia barduliensis TaxID=2736643 RepID=UPI001C2CED78